MPPAAGRGQGAATGRGGDRAGGRGAPAPGRGASASRPVPVPAPQAAAQQQAAAPTSSATPVEVQQIAVSAPVVASVPVSVPTSNGASGWGRDGTTLAAKLKQAEIQRLLPPPAPVVHIEVVDQTEVSQYRERTRCTLLTAQK